MFENFIPVDLFDTGLLIAAATVFAGGLIRGFSGFGSALIHAPMLSWIWGPQIGVPVTALVEIGPVLLLAPTALRESQRRTVWALGIPAVLLMPLGALILISVPPDDMRRANAAIVLLLALILWTGWRYRGPRGLGPEIGVGMLGGTLAGAAGVAGPPAILYMMASGDAPARIRANLIGYFTLILVGLTATFALNGLTDAAVLWKTAAMIPPFILGTWIGMKLFPLASERLFRNIALATLAASSTWVLLN
ncbi:MAG: sulfite exporter TauE/SafE family protein [Alphaproteobacteria bacterium]